MLQNCHWLLYKSKKKVVNLRIMENFKIRKEKKAEVKKCKDKKYKNIFKSLKFVKN